MKIKIVLLMICSYLLILSCPTFAKTGGPPGGHLQITEVFVIEGDPDTLLISGMDFDFGNGELFVTLGEEGELLIVSATDTDIEVELPDLLPGDYLLSVFREGGQSQGDEYGLTIGAVGPEGPPGPQGDPGSTVDVVAALCVALGFPADCDLRTSINCGDNVVNFGEGCDDGNTVDGDGCSYNCQVESCLDTYETNDSRGSASNLGSINDDATYPSGTLTATLSGPGDVDWYKFQVSDTSFGSVQPKVELESIPAQSDYTLCAYFECITPGTDPSVTCNSGSAAIYDGFSGCCSLNSGSSSEQVSLNVDCDNATFTPDDGWIYVLVSNASSIWSCDNYSLPWGDN